MNDCGSGIVEPGVDITCTIKPLRYADYQQATEYRNDYRQHSMKEKIEVCLMGGKKGNDLPHNQDKEQNVKIVLFTDVIATARRQLQWLLSELAGSSV